MRHMLGLSERKGKQNDGLAVHAVPDHVGGLYFITTKSFSCLCSIGRITEVTLLVPGKKQGRECSLLTSLSPPRC